MLLPRSPRRAHRRGAPLALLAAVLLCATAVSASMPGKVTSDLGLEEEIDYLQSIIKKQQVKDIKPPKKKPKQDAALPSQTDADKSNLNSRGLMLDEAPLATVSALPSTPTPEPIVIGRSGPVAEPSTRKDSIMIVMISLFVALGIVALITATVCCVKLQKDSRLAEKVEYPAYGGVSEPAANTNGTSVGDKTLAQNAQMYHYQHQKQQMISMGNHKPEQKSLDTEVTSDEEDVGGDFTVYECPGLAPTGEMEVKNPLFDDSSLNFQGNHK
ncbi:neural proliferation differentiation and control protein 1-like isoform X1 [Brachionichthys hirsutus]|uniref:neural proliferation differentiation and control protein 1-like isoform X1 n=1 Tax=Brachionichthys hirsutus TaxID=412623 RepID=UPI003604B772